jgi:cephalosporin hydroxylase
MSRLVSMEVFRNQASRAAQVYREEGLAACFGKMFQVPMNLAKSSLCRLQIKTLDRDARIEELVDFVCRSNAIGAIQVNSELIRMLEVVRQRKPRTVVEIGTADGGTLFLLCSVAPSDALIASIDLPGGKFGGGYSSLKIPLYREFAHGSQKIHLLRGNSHSDEMFNELVAVLSGRPVEFLFIDGDHTYEGAKRDFELYSPLVSKGGIIGFHDIAADPATGYGTGKVWNEVKSAHKWQEIIADPNQKAFGIGLLEKLE